jgi:hypothetical protein
MFPPHAIHMATTLVHCASSRCSAAPDRAFAYLSDPGRLGEWALGCWDAVDDGTETGTVKGISLFDDSVSFARVDPDPERLVADFEVGSDPTRLTRRISARIVPGSEIDADDRSCLVILTAWRADSMDDDRWHRLVVAHEAEIVLLRHRIEVLS